MNHENIKLSDKDIIEVLYIAYKKVYHDRSILLCEALSYSLYICTSNFVTYLGIRNYIPEFNSKFLVGRKISINKEQWDKNNQKNRLETLTKLIDIYTLRIFKTYKKLKNKRILEIIKKARELYIRNYYQSVHLNLKYVLSCIYMSDSLLYKLIPECSEEIFNSKYNNKIHLSKLKNKEEGIIVFDKLIEIYEEKIYNHGILSKIRLFVKRMLNKIIHKKVFYFSCVV